MFVYCQKSGEFWRVNGLGETAGDPIADTGMYGFLLGVGYSGRNTATIQGRNNPDAQNVSNVGPIPRGPYTIGASEHHPVLGPLALPLSAEDGNSMFGRGDFWIHGDNVSHDASHGCIVAPRDVRSHVSENAADGNNHLLVME